MRAIQVEAYAKLNLYLRIVDERADGYHEIETVLQSISLGDELLFEKGTDKGITFEVRGREVPTGSDNLVLQAAQRLKERAAWQEGVRIELTKQIPVAAGLGGGSANAAATLIALNRLFDLKLSDEELSDIALSVGMDVPFFLKGGTALGTGRGEHLQSVNNQARFYAVIVYPDLSISTPEAYQLYDKVSVKHGPGSETILTALETNDFPLLCSSLFNSFEQALVPFYRAINEIKDELREGGAKAACLCGSGSAVFGIVADEEQGKQVQARLANRYPFVRLVAPISCSIKARAID